mmetsp:Transcript_74598/g.155546  ORF Transcript_74598/g.155546 Transcript_74598/m.155546 type:complete len:234 (-) Transcript_74598:6-707(-)
MVRVLGSSLLFFGSLRTEVAEVMEGSSRAQDEDALLAQRRQGLADRDVLLRILVGEHGDRNYGNLCLRKHAHQRHEDSVVPSSLSVHFHLDVCLLQESHGLCCNCGFSRCWVLVVVGLRREAIVVEVEVVFHRASYLHHFVLLPMRRHHHYRLRRALLELVPVLLAPIRDLGLLSHERHGAAAVVEVGARHDVLRHGGHGHGSGSLEGGSAGRCAQAVAEESLHVRTLEQMLT